MEANRTQGVGFRSRAGSLDESSRSEQRLVIEVSGGCLRCLGMGILVVLDRCKSYPLQTRALAHIIVRYLFDQSERASLVFVHSVLQWV